MTDAMVSLWALIEKAPDADPLREMIGSAAQRLMELEVGELPGVPARARRVRSAWCSGTAIATRRERRSRPPSSEEAAISPASSSSDA